jgi:hypothetical protein
MYMQGPSDWTTGVRSPTEAEDFSSSLCIQNGSGAHPASCTMGTGGSFPRGKVQPGHDADHSPPSSAEVKNEQELYLLSSQAPPWRVAGSLYLFLIDTINNHSFNFQLKDLVIIINYEQNIYLYIYISLPSVQLTNTQNRMHKNGY